MNEYFYDEIKLGNTKLEYLFEHKDLKESIS